jgi:hypothetical protein
MSWGAEAIVSTTARTVETWRMAIPSDPDSSVWWAAVAWQPPAALDWY